MLTDILPIKSKSQFALSTPAGVTPTTRGAGSLVGLVGGARGEALAGVNKFTIVGNFNAMFVILCKNRVAVVLNITVALCVCTTKGLSVKNNLFMLTSV